MGFGDFLKGVLSNVTAPIKAAMDSPIGRAAVTGVEQVASGAHWLYSEVARGASTFGQTVSSMNIGPVIQNPVQSAIALLGGHDPAAAYGGLHLDKIVDVTHPDVWAQNWQRSKYISVGQANALASVGGPQQVGLNVDDPAAVKDYFSSGPQKFASGANDFLANWYGDPTMLAGKAVKVVRAGNDINHLISRNTSLLVKATKTGARLPTVAEKTAGQEAAFSQAAQKGGLFDRIINATAGKSANQIMQYNFARQSTNGPLLAHLLSTAETPAEKASVFKLSLGDNGAYSLLERQNKEIAAQINYATDRWSSLSSNMENLTEGSPALDIARTKMDEYSQQLKDLDDRYSVVKSKMDLYNTSDNLKFGVGAQFAAHARAVRHDVVQPSIYDRPLMIARSVSRMHPNGYIDLSDPNSIKEVEAQLEHAGKTTFLGKQKGAITPEVRDQMLSDYAGANTKEDRQRVVAGIEKTVADQISSHYGFTKAEGDKIYAAWAAKRSMALDSTTRFSAARYTDDAGNSIPVDHFTDDGGALLIAPPLRSQMQRSHIFLDMDQYDQALRLHGDGVKAVMRTATNAAKLGGAMSQTFQSYWKLAIFARLGFAVRQVSDDLLGQTARFGVMDMMSRMKDGGLNMMRGNIARHPGLLHSSLKDASDAHIADMQETVDYLAKDITRLTKLGNPATDPVLKSRLQSAVTQHDLGKQLLDDALAENAKIPQTYKAGMQGFTAHGVTMPGAFEGESGEMFRKMVSSDANQQAMLGIASEKTHELLRSGHWEILSPGVDQSRHLDGWLHVGKFQFGTDPLARKVLAGESRTDVQRWLIGTPEGRNYFQTLGLKNQRSGDLFDRVKAEIDQYFPPERPELRQAILDGKLTRDMLDKAIPVQYRPDIHTARTDFNMGKGFLAHKADKAISGFYRWFQTIPHDVLSRNPLFAQQYEAHANRMVQLAADGGKTHWTIDEVNNIANKARAFAKRDTLRFVADMSHRSNAAQALRTVSPFFNAIEAVYSRWGRIIMDKPQVLGAGAKIFQAPVQAGIAVDQYGNKIDGSGYAVDPSTGKKYLVPQSQRTLLLGSNLIPWLKKGQKLAISQGSLDVIFQGTPAGLPGTGPVVAIPVNQLLKDKPGLADMAQSLGLLSGGLSTKSIFDQILPSSLRDLKNWLATDESSEDYQRIYLGILQSEYAKHQMGWRPTAATYSEIKNKTKMHFALSALTHLTLPFAVTGQGADQYLINEYKRMQAEDPKNADTNFYNKYGDAAFAYTAHVSKENVAVPTTKEGFAAFEKYKGLIQQNPDLAGLIIGSDGKGNYDANVYQAELATSVGGPISEKIRGKQSPADAMADAQKREGWVIFNKYNTKLKAELVDRGMTKFSQAPDLEAAKKGLVKILSDPNSQYYNDAWAKDYATYDSQKYARMIPAMEKIAADPTLSKRADIQMLGKYLNARKDVVSILAQRKASGGSSTLTATSNADLLNVWDTYVGSLTEQNLDFEALHNRYLSKDLGVSVPATGTDPGAPVTGTAPATGGAPSGAASANTPTAGANAAAQQQAASQQAAQRAGAASFANSGVYSGVNQNPVQSGGMP